MSKYQIRHLSYFQIDEIEAAFLGMILQRQ